VLAFYLHSLSPFLFEFRPGIGLRWYGLAYVLSFLLGFLLYKRLAGRGYTDLPPAQVSDFITWAAVFGVFVGGRIGWIVFYGLKQDHAFDPWWWPVEVWKGGMSSHGGIIGLALFTLYWSRRHRVSWTSIGDCLVVVAPIGLFLVRVANFINGELFGRIANVPWAMLFPAELYDDLGMRDRLGLRSNEEVSGYIEAARHTPELAAELRTVLTPRHPSQLYEAALEGLVLFGILYWMRTRLRLPRGVLTGAFFVLYALLRIIGEFFREPDRAWSVGPLSAGQFLSLFMILIGGVFVAYGLRTREYERAVASPKGRPATA
jgi:phosphatidylglycerol:prolipoprotein diacylglycerol transferase